MVAIGYILHVRRTELHAEPWYLISGILSKIKSTELRLTRHCDMAVRFTLVDHFHHFLWA